MDKQPPPTTEQVLNKSWSIPSWVSARSYADNTPAARTILTNACRWTNIVLAGLSADLWNLLPARFSLGHLANDLRGLGVDLSAPNARAEVLDFLKSLRSEGLLKLEGSDAPPPGPSPDEFRMDRAGGFVSPSSVEMQFNEWLIPRKLLPTALIELTYGCNQRCIHCFNPGAPHGTGKRSARETRELSTAEVFVLLDEMVEIGVYSVTFTGGEPSLRPDFLDILRRAKQMGLSFNVFTNGQISETMAEDICSLWPRTLGISLYSAVPTIHDETTGIPGSFARSLATVRLVAAHGVRTTVKCPLMRHTVHGYRQIAELCEELNVLPQFDLHISPGMDGDRTCLAHQIQDEEVLAILMRDPRIAFYVGLDAPNAGRQPRPMDASVCGAGTHVLSIAPEGTVYPCNSLPLAVGNIRSGGLRQVWEQSKALASWSSVTLSDYNECGLHAHCAFCNHCPGMAMADCGDPLATHETCCMTASIRMRLSQTLQAGRDLLDEITTVGPGNEAEYDASAGHPTMSERTEMRRAKPAPDPRHLPANTFFECIGRIHLHGNPVRRARTPESGSPATEDLKEADLQTADRFRELGR